MFSGVKILFTLGYIECTLYFFSTVSPYVQQSVGSAESSSTDTMSFTEATVMSGSVGFVVGVIVTLLVGTLLVSVIVCRRKAKINRYVSSRTKLHIIILNVSVRAKTHMASLIKMHISTHALLSYCHGMRYIHIHVHPAHSACIILSSDKCTGLMVDHKHNH